MRVDIRCLNPDCQKRFDAIIGTAPDPVTCPHCGRGHPWNAGSIKDGRLHTCPLCGSDELYVRKDFPQRLGVLMVIVVGIASFWLFAKGDLLWALGILVALVLLDLVIYQMVGKITVCYRCRAEFRGLPVNPEHRGFDLATAEKYRK